ncbi:hypothetical protein GE09DRAFT_1067221 [Coniochaeta sp. 2T2.1]|nr:hypothetical protein GE09DRAFT_1067221 [Coniochaeta sp. 2T2.1]
MITTRIGVSALPCTQLAKAITARRVTLQPPNRKGATFDSRAEEHNARCHHDTRTDLLHRIRTWADDPLGECKFWLKGMAGTGKPTVSRTVAEVFEKQGVLGASFFKRGEDGRGDAALFVTTLTVQLARTIPLMAPNARSAIESDYDIATKALKNQFDKLILQPLSRIQPTSERPPRIVEVVDALDECDRDDDIKLIIYLFSQTKVLSSIRTARITDAYNSQAFDSVQLSPDWPGEHNIQTLVRKAIPFFIFAATICRFVGDRTWSNLAGQLHKVLQYQRTGDSELDNWILPIKPFSISCLLGRQSQPEAVSAQEGPWQRARRACRARRR